MSEEKRTVGLARGTEQDRHSTGDGGCLCSLTLSLSGGLPAKGQSCWKTAVVDRFGGGLTWGLLWCTVKGPGEQAQKGVLRLAKEAETFGEVTRGNRKRE